MNRKRTADAARLSVSAFGLLLWGAAQAPAQSLYKTGRIVEQSDNACLKAEECASYETEEGSVAAGQSVEVAYECPADRPYLRNWDATHQEHVSLSLSPARIGNGALTLIAYNQADVPGAFKVVLGCAASPAGVTSVMQSVGSRPTNVAAVRRNNQ